MSMYYSLKNPKQTAEDPAVKVSSPNEKKARWIISGVVITFLVSTFLLSHTGGSDAVDSEEYDNPYEATSIDHVCGDFDTQEDAQLSYEANGGPYESPHYLDRDNNGLA
ncbi:MAG: hypothetical protein ACQEXE_21955 [Bacillota bacterium]|uniref:hypothetical protein n=1 Tax=Bacillales TaxID=1385 RepID=UPI0011158EED|nr:hypothetical protein [Paenibacillus sp. FSL R5-0490]